MRNIQYQHLPEAYWDEVAHLIAMYKQEMAEHGFLGHQQDLAEQDSDELLLSGNSQAYVAIDSGRMIGFAIKAEFNAMHEFLTCFVAKEYRRAGIGSELLFCTLNQFAGDWQIKVDEDNALGQEFVTKALSRFQRGFSEQQLIADPCYGLVHQHTFYVSETD